MAKRQLEKIIEGLNWWYKNEICKDKNKLLENIERVE